MAVYMQAKPAESAMLNLKKILLPVDFSEHGAGAARYAGALARHFRAQLTLLHVNPTTAGAREFSGPIDTGWITALESQRRRDLDTYQATEFRDVALLRVVLTGDPAHLIVEHAHAGKTDLIVMPTRGYGLFRRFLLGSVAAKVLHDADCPVWTGVHMEVTAPANGKVINHILCAIDNGPSSERVLDWAWNFAGEFNAVITVVHAARDFPEAVFDPDWQTGIAEEARKRVQCFFSKTGARGEIVIEPGEPARVVDAAATRLHADLVVIGRNPAAGRRRLHTYSIIQDSPCPAVSV